jgi:hypothetical protein
MDCTVHYMLCIEKSRLAVMWCEKKMETINLKKKASNT